MKRFFLFAGFLILLVIVGYPFYEELNYLQDVKEAREQFKSTQRDSQSSVRDVRSNPELWNDLPSDQQERLSEMGMFPATIEKKSRPFKLKDIQGTIHTLKDHRGNWIVLNFWATWCPPCRMEMPSLQNLQEKFNDQNFLVLAINVQEPRHVVESFKKKYELTFPVLLDRKGVVGEQYKLTGVPETWIINPEGIPIAKINGPREWDDEQTVTFFSNALE